MTVTAVILPASLALFDVSLALSPDSVTTRAAVLGSLAAFLARHVTVSSTIPHSRLDEAVDLAIGECAPVIAALSGDIVPAATTLPTLGTVTFTSGAALLPPLA